MRVVGLVWERVVAGAIVVVGNSVGTGKIESRGAVVGIWKRF